MPYIAYQYADYEGYDEAITGLDIGSIILSMPTMPR